MIVLALAVLQSAPRWTAIDIGVGIYSNADPPTILARDNSYDRIRYGLGPYSQNVIS